jgi:hypothetical protein
MNATRLAIALSTFALVQSYAAESTTNRVLRLDGRTGYMVVADSPSLHALSNAMTLELWFQASSFYKSQGAVNSLLRKNVEAGSENFFLRFRILDGKPIVEASPGLAVGVAQAPFDFKLGKWYHLAATYDGSNIRIFVDGAPIHTAAFSGSMRIDQSELVIGKGDPEFSEGEYFHGAVDEIRIWSVARTPAEIQGGMKGKLTAKEPGLVAYWTFDDGTAEDKSNHGNRGVLKEQALIEPAARQAVTPSEPGPRAAE